MAGSTAGDALDEEQEEGQQRPKTPQHPQIVNRRMVAALETLQRRL